MSALIGTVCRYTGGEHAFLRHTRCYVRAVLRDERVYITTDVALAALGGLQPGDRADVTPWIRSEGRWSWVTSDPLVADLTERVPAWRALPVEGALGPFRSDSGPCVCPSCARSMRAEDLSVGATCELCGTTTAGGAA